MWFDLSSLTPEQITQIIVVDYLEGYSTKQIMEMYHLSFEQVATYRNDFENKVIDGIDLEKLKKWE